MVQVWQGPDGKIALGDKFGMGFPNLDWAFLLYCNGERIRIETRTSDCKVSKCGKWKVIHEDKDYKLKENKRCPTCGNEL